MKIIVHRNFILIGVILGLQVRAWGSAQQCDSVFTTSTSVTTSQEKAEHFPSSFLKSYYKKIGSWDAAPAFHIFNSDALLAHLKSKGEISVELAPFEKGIDNGLNQLILKDYSSSFIIVKSEKKSEGINFTLKDVMGRWFTIHGKKGLLPSSYKLDFSTFEFVPNEENNLNDYSGYLRKAYDETRISKMSVQQLAEYLTTLQIKTSTNAHKSSHHKRNQFIEGISEANLMLAELLKSNAPLTEADLAKMNFFANKGINPYEFKTNAPMAGVIRGTSNTTVIVNGKATIVDLSLFEVAQTWKMKIDASVQRLNYFLPAKEVPGKVKELLARINRLNKTSNSMEVFELYKEFIQTHPFADGNGRTGRMLLNYLLLKTGLPPATKPAASMFFRPQDSLRKYIQDVEKEFGRKAYKNTDQQTYNFKTLRSFKDIQDIPAFTKALINEYKLDSLNLDHLHGTLAYLFVAVYKGRYIQFESTHDGGLSDSLQTMILKSKELIDQQEAEAKRMDNAPLQFAVYPELLKQFENYHQMYQEHDLVEVFHRKNKHLPNDAEMALIHLEAEKNWNRLLDKAKSATSDYEFIKLILETPRSSDHVQTAEEVADRIMTITAPAYQKKVYESMTVKSSPESKKAIVDIYNAFNSTNFDEFMTVMSLKALKLCRQALECGPQQRSQIPEKFLALVLKNEAAARGILLETISRQAGREPGRLYIQRIRRGSLVIDEGAPGNHGLMPHALQNLFIYEQIGTARAKKFFGELAGWAYERMFDANADFTPIPATRDITRRHYWTGIILSGNRSESSKLGSLAAEDGKYPDFIRKNNLDLVEVLEKEKNLVNVGATIKARFKSKIFEFEIDRDGVPLNGSQNFVDQIKSEVPL